MRLATRSALPEWARMRRGSVARPRSASQQSNGLEARPHTLMAWLTSDEGKELVGLSSEGWCAANIAAGAAEADAQGARDRTTAAYTGAAPEAAPA